MGSIVYFNDYYSEFTTAEKLLFNSKFTKSFEESVNEIALTTNRHTLFNAGGFIQYIHKYFQHINPPTCSIRLTMASITLPDSIHPNPHDGPITVQRGRARALSVVDALDESAKWTYLRAVQCCRFPLGPLVKELGLHPPTPYLDAFHYDSDTPGHSKGKRKHKSTFSDDAEGYLAEDESLHKGEKENPTDKENISPRPNHQRPVALSRASSSGSIHRGPSRNKQDSETCTEDEMDLYNGSQGRQLPCDVTSPVTTSPLTHLISAFRLSMSTSRNLAINHPATPAKQIEILHGQQSALLSNNYDGYRPHDFRFVAPSTVSQGSTAYDVWLGEKKRFIDALLQRLPGGKVSSANSIPFRSGHDDYQLLFDHLSQYDIMSTRLDEESPELSKISKTILNEFSILYGVGELYCQLVYLDFLLAKFQLTLSFLSAVALRTCYLESYVCQKMRPITVSDYTKLTEVLRRLDDLIRMKYIEQDAIFHLIDQQHVKYGRRGLQHVLTILKSCTHLRQVVFNEKVEPIGVLKSSLQACCNTNYRKMATKLSRNDEGFLTTKDLFILMKMASTKAEQLIKHLKPFVESKFNLDKLIHNAYYAALMDSVALVFNTRISLWNVEPNLCRDDIALMFKLNNLDRDWYGSVSVCIHLWRQEAIQLAILWLKELTRASERFLENSIKQCAYKEKLLSTTPHSSVSSDDTPSTPRLLHSNRFGTSNNSAFTGTALSTSTDDSEYLTQDTDDRAHRETSQPRPQEDTPSTSRRRIANRLGNSTALVDLVVIIQRYIDFTDAIINILWPADLCESKNKGIKKKWEEVLAPIYTQFCETRLNCISMLMSLFAENITWIDLCQTPEDMAELCFSSNILHSLKNTRKTKKAWTCRHLLENKPSCSEYPKKNARTTMDKYEPISLKMLVRINDVSCLHSIYHMLLGPCGQKVKPAYHQDVQNLIGDKLLSILEGLVNLLSDRLNLFIANAMEMIFTVDSELWQESLRFGLIPLRVLEDHLVFFHQHLRSDAFRFVLGNVATLVLRDCVFLCDHIWKCSSRITDVMKIIEYMIKDLKRIFDVYDYDLENLNKQLIKEIELKVSAYDRMDPHILAGLFLSENKARVLPTVGYLLAMEPAREDSMTPSIMSEEYIVQYLKDHPIPNATYWTDVIIDDFIVRLKKANVLREQIIDRRYSRRSTPTDSNLRPTSRYVLEFPRSRLPYCFTQPDIEILELDVTLNVDVSEAHEEFVEMSVEKDDENDTASFVINVLRGRSQYEKLSLDIMKQLRKLGKKSTFFDKHLKSLL